MKERWKKIIQGCIVFLFFKIEFLLVLQNILITLILSICHHQLINTFFIFLKVIKIFLFPERHNSKIFQEILLFLTSAGERIRRVPLG